MSTLLLSVQEATFGFGNQPLFAGLSFNIHEGEKICLIGRNGAGKTTLMNIIRGLLEPDDGKVWRKDGLKVGYLQQEVAAVPGQSVFDFVFAEMPDDEQHDGNAYKVDMVIRPLELDPRALMETLSGGQLRRAALARALVESPDILLMDEPTNHLDLHVIEWLENYLVAWRGALVCVSHDKTFLENVSQKVFWLDRGKLRVCPRGFGFFDEWVEQLLEQEERELRNREKMLEVEVKWSRQGVKARRKRNVRRLELMKEEREKLKRDVNAFNRMMAKVEMPEMENTDGNQTRILAQFRNVGKSFGEGERAIKILEGFDLRVLRGDRIGVLGRNGSGKTTFLRLLTGELEPDAGTIKRARNIELSYFDQNRRDLDPKKSLWQTLCPSGGDHVNVRGTPRHVVGYLKDFMFDPGQAHQPVATLSGGQKNRLMLARILANPGNLLILDEPTNDLDMDTLDMLEQVLSEYKGTLIVVSHDRDFLDQTVSKILAFEGNARVEGHIGGYSDYLKAQTEPAKVSGRREEERGSAPAAAKKERRQLSYKLQYELDNLPDKIVKLEQEIKLLEDILADPDLYARDKEAFENAGARLAGARDELDKTENRWLELTQAAEA